MSSSPIDSNVNLTKPFSSDTESEKEDLLREADLYRFKLESQWDDLKHDASGYGKQALIIGGVVVTTYILLEAILPNEKKKDEMVYAEPGRLAIRQGVPKNKSKFAVGQAVQSLVWTLAVGWARKKLQDIIAVDHESDENNKL